MRRLLGPMITRVRAHQTRGTAFPYPYQHLQIPTLSTIIITDHLRSLLPMPLPCPVATAPIAIPASVVRVLGQQLVPDSSYSGIECLGSTEDFDRRFILQTPPHSPYFHLDTPSRRYPKLFVTSCSGEYTRFEAALDKYHSAGTLRKKPI